MQTTRIRSFRRIGKRKTLDIEVNHPDHNFYCEGLVTSNSHSRAYSSLSAKTLWLKYKYPKEFFCSILELSNEDPDPLKVVADVAREIADFGIKLLPPNLEDSSIDFKIEGNDIRYGLSSIKGISANTKEALKQFVEIAPKNKYEVFSAAKTCKINIEVLTSLIYAGALGPEDRSKKVLEARAFSLLTDAEKRNFSLIGREYNFDLLKSIVDAAKTQRLGDNNKPIIKESRFETFKKRFEPHKKLFLENRKHEDLSIWWFEKSLLGYSFSKTLKDCFNVKEDVYDLKQIEFDKIDNWRAIAILDDFFVRTSKKGNRYMKLDISDDFGKASLLFCDSEKEKKLTNFLDMVDLKKGAIVTVSAQRSDSGAQFVDSIKLITDKVYLKSRDLKK